MFHARDQYQMFDLGNNKQQAYMKAPELPWNFKELERLLEQLVARQSSDHPIY